MLPVDLYLSNTCDLDGHALDGVDAWRIYGDGHYVKGKPFPSLETWKGNYATAGDHGGFAVAKS